jgi:lipopolysaccharide biosynthesis glycosyltransferase
MMVSFPSYVFCSLLFFLLSVHTTLSSSLTIQNNAKNKNSKRAPIRVALAVDEQSFKDLLIVINSIISTAEDPSRVIFHIVSCGSDIDLATILQEKVLANINNCFINLRHVLVPFTLPIQSGFYNQLKAAKSVSHWVSPSGADMVRFFLPSLFPKVRRLLYLDNDVIVSCCLEEIYFSRMSEDQIIGIALDDLKWATVTQFKNHYNASHPLVIKNIRYARNENLTGSINVMKNGNKILNLLPVTQDEFWKVNININIYVYIYIYIYI